MPINAGTVQLPNLASVASWRLLFRGRNIMRVSIGRRIRHVATLAATGFASMCFSIALAQAPPSVVLKLDLKDFVVYQIDVSDPAKLATDP